MGYSIYIGEGYEVTEDDWTHPTVDEVYLPEAPAFPGDEATNNYNRRWPSYSAWGNFLEDVGLYSVFLGPNGLMAEHPGMKPFTQTHAELFDLQLERYREKHPQAVPQYRDRYPHDYNLARLMWLCW